MICAWSHQPKAVRNPMTSRPSNEIASSLVEECYLALLQREPDASGLQEKVSRLEKGEVTLKHIIREIVGSDEFMTKLPALLFKRTHGSGARLTNDSSQYGEVWMLIRRWVNAQAICGIVVDVGARGRERSNSFDLMRHFGWQGLLVEANPALLPSIEQDFAGCDMRLVSCAVSDYTGKATFTLGSNDDVSSLDASLARGWGDTRGEVAVVVRRLADVLKENTIPHAFDLLSLDIEGEDIKVLNDLIGHSAYRPEWVIIEASLDFKVKTLQDGPFSTEVRAEYRVCMATNANLILCRRYPEREMWRANIDA